MARGGKYLLTLVVLSLVPVLAFTGAAQAADDRVDGMDALTDDWGEHYNELGNSICESCPDSSNTDLVLMWQAVLFSENYLEEGGLDGDFGPMTDAATEDWQRAAGGLSVDGWVGDNTWGKADGRLRWRTENADPEVYFVRYEAENGSGYVEFARGSTSSHDDGDYRLLRAYQGGNTVTFGGSSQISFYSRNINKN